MHVFFAVSDRKSLITNTIETHLYGFLCAICKKKNHFIHAIGGTKDHIHMLIGMHPSESVSNLIQSLKCQSSKWLNDYYFKGRFRWQSGYAAFSYSKSMIPIVKRYVENQKEHHRRKTFNEEIIEILEKAGIDYHHDFLMKGIDD